MKEKICVRLFHSASGRAVDLSSIEKYLENNEPSLDELCSGAEICKSPSLESIQKSNIYPIFFDSNGFAYWELFMFFFGIV